MMTTAHPNPASLMTRLGRRGRAAIGVLLAAIFFLAINIWAEISLPNQRLDTTAEQLYTLTIGTKDVLASIDEPVTLRLVRSRSLDGLGPQTVKHAQRVAEMLDLYRRLANGKLRIETVNVDPFSAAEDLAEAAKISSQTNTAGARFYLGLIGTNSTDGFETIDRLSPTRARFLEYDLSRLIHDLATPRKPVVGVLGELPIFGDRTRGLGAFTVLEGIRGFFEIRPIMGKVSAIDDDIDIIMLAQAVTLDPQTLYAIDQFVMRGGAILAFVDPLSEALPRPPDGAAINRNAVPTISPLLWHWGAAVSATHVAADRQAAIKVSVTQNGRQVVTDYVAWGEYSDRRLAATETITGNLRRLQLRSSGIISATGNPALTIHPLISTSADSMRLAITAIEPVPNPIQLLADFKATGAPLVLAARLSGTVTSAYPDGPPAEIADPQIRGRHRATASSPLAMVLVADSDLLSDQTWLETRADGGKVPFANNADFVINALDQLSGGAKMMDLRGRGVGERRLTVLDDMNRQAETASRAREAEFSQAIDQLRSKIESRTSSRRGGAMSVEDALEIETLRSEILTLRQQLRASQFDVQKQVRDLTKQIQAANIWAVPLSLGVILLVLTTWRWLGRRRALKLTGTAVQTDGRPV